MNAKIATARHTRWLSLFRSSNIARNPGIPSNTDDRAHERVSSTQRV
jgi:hypothetical protein